MRCKHSLFARRRCGDSESFRYVASLVDRAIYSESPAWADTFVDSIGVDSTFVNHDYPPLVTQELENVPNPKTNVTATFDVTDSISVLHIYGK